MEHLIREVCQYMNKDYVLVSTVLFTVGLVGFAVFCLACIILLGS